MLKLSEDIISSIVDCVSSLAKVISATENGQPASFLAAILKFWNSWIKIEAQNTQELQTKLYPIFAHYDNQTVTQ